MIKKTIKRLVPIEVKVVETTPTSIRVIKGMEQDFKRDVRKVKSLKKYFKQKNKL